MNPIIDLAAASTPVEHDPFAAKPLATYFPITASQREIWLASQLGDDVNLAYNEGLEITLRGMLDEPALLAALQTVLDRHEGLRARFSADGEWMVVQKSLSLAEVFTHEDLRGTSDPLASLAALDSHAMATPFDVEAGPLVRFTLVRLADDEHRLLFVGHHLVCDGWSGAVVITEIGALYSAAVEGLPSPLKAPQRYGDYSLIERAFHESAEGRAHEAFWLDKLKDTPAILDLPGDRPRPPQRSYTASRIDHPLSAALVKELKRTGAEQGASLVTVMLAGFAALLNRLTGSEDMIIGLSAAGQSQHQMRQLVGHCVNKLPLRLQPRRNAPFNEFLRAARNEMLDAQDHQGVTYGSLLPKLALERDESRPPLISISFNIDVRNDDIRHAGLEVSYRTMVRQSDNLELYINVVDNGRDLLLETCYNAQLFDADTVRRRIGEYETLLTDLCRQAEAPISTLQLLDEKQRQHLLHGFHRKAEALPLDLPIHRWVEQQALRTPDALAVVSATESLSYDALNRRANQLAHWLREQGVAADVPVAVCVQRSASALVALLATLKAGGAYLPLDPEYPAERLAFMLQDAAPPVVISNFGDSPALGAAERLALSQGVACGLDLVSDAGLLAQLPQGNLDGAQSTESLAYVIYTSGSTGKPKGTRLAHRGPLNQYAHYIKALAITPDSRFLVFTSLAFDLTQRNLWAPLMAGGSVVLVDSPSYDAGDILALAEQHRITHLCCTPSAFYPLLEDAGEAAFAKLASLRQLALGGEAIQLHRLQPWRKSRHCQASLTNCYGPTEASANVAMFHLRLGEMGNAGAAMGGLPIGEANPNVELHVLDQNGNVLPLGVAGELHIGGVQLARDYLNRPELTAERFIQHPALGRLYRTGDLCLRRTDGLLEYRGRIDFQVKLRGFRIELGEIESVLNRRDEVAESFVTVVNRSDNDPRLVAYLVPQTGLHFDAAAVRRELRAALPDYMVPQHLVALERFPLTANGKLDRKALPAPFEAEAGSARAASTAPRTAQEKTIAALWAEVIGIRDVGVDDRFFDIGGHSLLGAKVAARLRASHGIKLPLRALLSETVAQLALRLTAPAPEAMPVPSENPLYVAPLADARLGWDHNGNPDWFTNGSEGPRAVSAPEVALAYNPFAGAELAARLPLTEPQHEIWLACALDPELSAAYHLGHRLKLDGPLDAERLAQCFTQLVSRHESLRAQVSSDGRWLAVLAATPAPLPVVDYTSEALAAAAAQLAMTTPLPLDQAPLWRAELQRLATGGHVLVLVLHHLICDGHSRDMLLRELGALYSAASLPPALRFGDYVNDHLQRVARTATSSRAFWLQRLADAPSALEWPLDAPRPASRSHVSATLRHAFSPGLAQRVRKAASEYRTSPLAVLAAALAAFTTRLGGQAQQIIGIPLAGQVVSAWPEVIGHAVHLLPMRVQTDTASGFDQQLKHLAASLDEVLQHPDTTLGALLPDLKLERSESRPVLVSAICDYQHAEVPPQFNGLVTQPSVLPAAAEFFELYFQFVDQGEDLSLELIYNTGLYQPESLHRRLAGLEHLLRAGLNNTAAPIAKLPLLTPADTEVLAAFNHTARDTPTDTVVARIHTQARSRPDAAAVVFGSGTHSYAVLESRANAIAAALTAAGAGPGRIIGVCIERRLDLPAALLGVLKTGAAYLPLDPEFPPERIAYYLEDSGAALLLGDAKSSEKLASVPCPVLQLESIGSSAGFSPVHVAPQSAAYVIYTSGSTGKPKGVVVPHSALANFLSSMADEPGLTAGDVLAAVTTVSFDIAALELWLPLTLGATVLLIDRDTAIDGLRLKTALERHAATVMQATPATWRLLLAAGWTGNPTGFRALSGGEPLPRELAEALLPRVAALWNLYGPTETTIWSTLHRVRDAQQPILIGHPIANTQCHVLDAALQVLPPGATGTLWIGGNGVATGYHAREQLTAERFVQHPQLGRIYNTGDLARLTPGGLECLGREDFQVKLRGYRIELGEIEYALSRHEAVTESAVLVRERLPGDLRLVAYVARKPGSEVNASELRKTVRGFLPPYMLPQEFVMLDALPRLPNGKLDRKSLPDPFANSVARAVREPLHTAAERRLAALWAEVLHLPDSNRISRDDRFFDLGGHSLFAVQLASLITQQTGTRPQLRALMMDPLSIAALQLEPKASSPVATPVAGNAPPAAPAAQGKRIGAADIIIPARPQPQSKPKPGWLARLFSDS